MFSVRSLIRSFTLLMTLAVPLAGAVEGAAPFGGLSTPALAQASPPGLTFVGLVDGTDAFIGLRSDGSGLTAYVCDGATNTIAEEFAGPAGPSADGPVTLRGESGSMIQFAADTGPLDASGVLSGSVITPDGVSHAFSAELAVEPAGLFQEDDAQLLDGSSGDGWWVVLNTGEVRGNSAAAAPRPVNFSGTTRAPLAAFGLSFSFLQPDLVGYIDEHGGHHLSALRGWPEPDPTFNPPGQADPGAAADPQHVPCTITPLARCVIKAPVAGGAPWQILGYWTNSPDANGGYPLTLTLQVPSGNPQSVWVEIFTPAGPEVACLEPGRVPACDLPRF